MATSSELLGFFDIPREIRDEIYRLYFSRGYRIPSTVAGGEIDNSMILLREPRYSRTSPQSRILQISQKMRCEAEEILYHDCTFYLDLTTAYSSNLCQTLADRITKLDVDFLAAASTSYIDPIFQKFIGGKLGRRFCSFTVLGSILSPVLSSGLLSTLLEKLVRYETVIIRLWVPRQIMEKLPGNELSQGRRKAVWPPMVPRDGRLDTESLRLFLEQWNKVRTGLASTLGPEEIYYEPQYLCVEFHPVHNSIRQHC